MLHGGRLEVFKELRVACSFFFLVDSGRRAATGWVISGISLLNVRLVDLEAVCSFRRIAQKTELASQTFLSSQIKHCSVRLNCTSVIGLRCCYYHRLHLDNSARSVSMLSTCLSFALCLEVR